ncbi:MAG: glycosyl hydrolases family 17 [SAR86 cluster bacterium SAR86B]|jgi:glucan 1,3-beta-glucosidase|uniref:Endo-1,3-beta-glucanase btgC n=1 Tax=SAR86 cluster bacterium SAR86B TaxID=1123867 RepID=J5KEC9_9GAMM|nr:MAG: glycosyl hydrolases family 17 [SAR86 cluster bacterium SAR86B]
MSLRDEKILSLLGTNLDKLSDEELKKLCKKILKSKIHGICFSLYEGDQQPGDIVSDDQIIRRLKILKPYTTSIRTFSSLGEHSRIVEIAKDMGFKTLVGAWLSDDFESNDKEIEGLIQLANKGLVDVAAVGNEVIYRKELSEEQLISYINNVKENIKNIPVGYVDAYYEFRDRPNITNACDVILANCYPFWEGCAAEYSLLYMKDMFNEALKASNGKKVIITETGWPSQGSDLWGAHPSYRNYLKYFINAQLWSKEKEIEMFYFSSFDESWKVDAEGDVGAYWGLWDKEEILKF